MEIVFALIVIGVAASVVMKDADPTPRRRRPYDEDDADEDWEMDLAAASPVTQDLLPAGGGRVVEVPLLHTVVLEPVRPVGRGFAVARLVFGVSVSAAVLALVAIALARGLGMLLRRLAEN